MSPLEPDASNEPAGAAPGSPPGYGVRVIVLLILNDPVTVNPLLLTSNPLVR